MSTNGRSSGRGWKCANGHANLTHLTEKQRDVKTIVMRCATKGCKAKVSFQSLRKARVSKAKARAKPQPV